MSVDIGVVPTEQNTDDEVVTVEELPAVMEQLGCTSGTVDATVPGLLDAAAPGPIDTGVTDPPGGGENEMTLQRLFNEMHLPIENTKNVCKEIEPFLTNALEKTPNSRVLREAAAYINAGITNGPNSGFVYSALQIHAIVHLLNGNEMLIQTGGANTDTHTLDDEEKEFLAQLEECDK
jgi:hypothetical protein